MKVGVIGVGAVGSATSLELIERGVCRELVLIDRDRARARAVALDMGYGAPLQPAVDVAFGEYDALTGAQLVVVTAGVNEKAGGATDRSDPHGRLRLLDTNAEVFREVVPRIVEVAPEAVLMVVTDPPDPLADLTRALAGHDRVFSTGTLIDSLRFRFHLGKWLGVRPRTVTRPTSWTRPLQYAVGALSAVYALWYGALPFWVEGPMSDEIRQRALQAAAANPALYPNPSQYADTVATFGVVLLVVVAVITVAVAIAVLIGTLRRWTWMYYVVMGLLALGMLSLPTALATALGIIEPAPALGGSLVVVQWSGVALGSVAIALGAWMLVALLRRGPWATRRVLPAQ